MPLRFGVMALYHKKVNAVQFVLSDEDKKRIRAGEKLFFEGQPIIYSVNRPLITLIKQGETLVRVEETQWLIRHPEGTLEVLWPDLFNQRFIKAPGPEQPVVRKNYSTNQPNVIV